VSVVERDWFKANRRRYDLYLVEPARELAEGLAHLGEPHMFRPYNDTRFHMRPPIKEQLGVAIGRWDPGGYYVELSLDGLLVAAGLYQPGSDQLARFRAASDDGRRPPPRPPPQRGKDQARSHARTQTPHLPRPLQTPRPRPLDFIEASLTEPPPRPRARYTTYTALTGLRDSMTLDYSGDVLLKATRPSKCPSA
jgi:hypothetical protein